MDVGLILVLGLFAFSFGACVASFLNVVAWRVPRGESIVSPPSHCPKCGAAIRWCQNVPILSWLALRGRCASCREPISPRYVVVELLGGVLFLAAFLQLRDADFASPLVVLRLAVTWTWIALMIVGSMIDFDHKLLPDFVTVGGMVLGVLYHGVLSLALFFNPPAHSIIRLFDYSIIHSLLGLAFGFGLLWLIRFFGSRAFGREAMGMGDVFLMGAVGALFGPVAALFALVVSSVFGSAVGVGMVALSKTKFGRFVEIPYGPYICLGCLCWMFFGPQLVSAYLGMFR